LKARFQVNEIITTLMLNYVAILWNNFWIFDRWSDAGFPDDAHLRAQRLAAAPL
jgi:ABC-type uncharacterized transport system permease subunit